VSQIKADPFNAAGEFSDDRSGPLAEQLEFLADGAQTWGQFKTPSLRNVALTEPYMHQGQFESLQQTLEYYSTLQGATFNDHHRETVLRPREFTKDEMNELIAFLQSLTDTQIDPSLMREPSSPLMPD
jgi:cytochrome c peroxidase